MVLLPELPLKERQLAGFLITKIVILKILTTNKSGKFRLPELNRMVIILPVSCA